MNRHEFVHRIATALLAGQHKSGDLADPSSATADATHVADKLPGLFRAGVFKIAAGFGSGTVQRITVELAGVDTDVNRCDEIEIS